VPSHEHYMKRALELAARGTGCTAPNPLVGSVLVRNDVIIGEGWHERFGQAHAEANAIADALQKDPTKTLIKGATIYVTLEPCNHQGNTPPCSRAIVEAGISHVVYALADPNPKAAGGAQWLETQGINTTGGVLEPQATYQNRFFLHAVRNNRPYVIAKSATSLDGRVATHTGHRTVRLPEEVCCADDVRHPLPIILDTGGKVELNTTLLSGDLPTKCLVLTSSDMDNAHREGIKANGHDVITVTKNQNGPGLSPEAVLTALYKHGIRSVLLEGGASVHGTFRDARLIDEIWTFIAPKIIGGVNAPSAFAGLGSVKLDDATELKNVLTEQLGNDILIRGLVVTPPATETPNTSIAADSAKDQSTQ